MNRADYIEKDRDQSPYSDLYVYYFKGHLAYIPGGEKQKIIRMRLKG